MLRRIRLAGYPARTGYELPLLSHVLRHNTLYVRLGRLPRYGEFASAFQRTLQIGVELEVRLPAHPVARRTCGPNLSSGPMRSLRLEGIGVNVPLGF
jgi:hypothetical protein